MVFICTCPDGLLRKTSYTPLHGAHTFKSSKDFKKKKTAHHSMVLISFYCHMHIYASCSLCQNGTHVTQPQSILQQKYEEGSQTKCKKHISKSVMASHGIIQKCNSQANVRKGCIPYRSFTPRHELWNTLDASHSQPQDWQAFINVQREKKTLEICCASNTAFFFWLICEF